jgi:hypothetical protein
VHGGKLAVSVAPVRILIIIAVVIFLVLWVGAVIDVLRRQDISGLGKLAWIVGMLVFPFVGLLIYTLARAART